MAKKVNLQILPDNVHVQASHDQTLLENLLKNKIQLDHSCGGMGSCGTCRVWIEKGLQQLSPRNEVESEFATERGFEANERLSCQIHPIEDLVIRYKKGLYKSK